MAKHNKAKIDAQDRTRKRKQEEANLRRAIERTKRNVLEPESAGSFKRPPVVKKKPPTEVWGGDIDSLHAEANGIKAVRLHGKNFDYIWVDEYEGRTSAASSDRQREREARRAERQRRKKEELERQAADAARRARDQHYEAQGGFGQF